MDVTELGPFTRVGCPQCGHEVRVKTEMGGYQLKSRLAEGGMSVIFVAQDKTLGREVAVKVLNDDYSAVSSRVAQFEQEARLTASVSHPNVVRVYTVGESYRRWFIAMELVSGQSLEVLMEERGALPQEEVVKIALQSVEGLQAAYFAGLIHRDVKPGNILIDDSGTVKIVDFGLSLLMDEMEESAGEIWATPYYVPPEALTDEEETFRSDIYSLGASLYHALSGHPPVEGLQPATRILQEEKRNVKPLGKMAPQLHPRVIALVERAMAYEPVQRFNSYDEFGEELKAVCLILAGDEGGATTISGERAERRSSVMKSMVLVVVTLLAVLASGGYFYWNEMRGNQSAVKESSSAQDQLLVPAGIKLGDSPEDSRRVSEYFRQARASLAARDYVSAERAFVNVANNEGAPPATRAWARFEAAIAAYLKGRPGDGQEHLEELQELLGSSALVDSVMGRRLNEPVEIMSGLPFVPEKIVPERLADPMKATIHFAYGLKMWEQGQLDRASILFQKWQSVGDWQEEEWVGLYQNIGVGYLEDHRSLALAGVDLEESDSAVLTSWIEELEEVYGQLQTRGRARFVVRELQAGLKRRMKNLEMIKEEPVWEGIRGKFLEHWTNGDFASAKKILLDFQPYSPEAVQKKTMTLALYGQAEDLMFSLAAIDGELLLQQAIIIGDEQFSKLLKGDLGGLFLAGSESEEHKTWSEIGMSSLRVLHLERVHEVRNPEARKTGLNQAVALSLLSGLSPEGDWLFARVAEEESPVEDVTWKELRAKLGL